MTNSGFSRAAAQISALTLTLLGLIVMSGWWFDIAAFKRLVPQLPNMAFNTALSFLAAGGSLSAVVFPSSSSAWHRRLAQRLLAGIVLTVGLLTLAEYVFGYDLRIDQLFVRDDQPWFAFPGRPAPITAVCLVIGGSSLFWVERRTMLSQILSLLLMGLASLAICGYLFEVPLLTRLSGSGSVALHAALGLLVLALGTLTARPSTGIMRFLTGDGAGSVMFRQMLVVPPVLAFLGWLALWGSRRHWYDAQFGFALMVISGLVAALLASAVVAVELERSDGDRRRLLRRLNSQLRKSSLAAAIVKQTDDAVIATSVDGIVLSWNPGAERVFGYRAQEMLGYPITRICPEEICDQPHINEREGRKAKQYEARRIRKDGVPIDVSITLSPIVDENEKIVAVALLARDITARKLVQQQALVAAITDSSEDAIVMTTADGTVLSWNSGAQTLYGYSAAEMIGNSIALIFPGDGAAERARLVAQLDGNRGSLRYEAQHLRKDGSLVDVSTTLATLQDEQGRITTISGITRDISARVQLQRQLAEVSSDLQHILERSPAQIGLWDENQRCRYANTAYARAYGHDPVSIRSQYIADVLGGELYAQAKGRIAAARAGESQSFEREVRLADGSIRHDMVDYLPDRRPASATGLLVYITDITRRKKAEQAAAENAQRYRALYERTPAILHSVDRDGRLLSVSEHWLQKLGYAREEVIGRLSTDFLTPESRRLAGDVALPRFRESGLGNDHEYQMVTKSGEVIDVLMSAIAERDAAGEYVRSLAVAVDVTARKKVERALRESESFLNRAGRLAGVGGWSYDATADRCYWSDEVCRIHEVPLGHCPTLEEAITFYPAAMREDILLALRECTDQGKPYDLELPLTTARGQQKWVRAAGEVEMDGDKVIRIFGAFQDITQRKHAETQIASQHALMRVTLDSIGEAVITTDPNGVIQWLNPVAAQLTGWQLSEARGQHIDAVFQVIHEDSGQPAPSPLARALAGTRVDSPEHPVLIARDGTERGIQDSAAPIRDEQGTVLGVVLVFHDVSEQRRLSREVSHRASHDSLTGLLNRAEFEACLSRAYQSTRHGENVHALLYIDLDRFKIVNDTCGHSAGDQLLREVSALFRHTIRSRDKLARLGGDEFGVLLEDCTLQQARRVADQLCERVDQYRFAHDERRFRVGASIGMVPVDGRWSAEAEIMQAADASCYAAKEAGRNRVHEWVDCDRRVTERQGETKWATQIEAALAEQRLRLYGQFIAGCSSPMRGSHLEVLLRLIDPQGRVIAPGAFLPAAERFNLVSRIDRWVLREVLNWMRSTDLTSIEIIAINLSGHSLGDRSFHEYAGEQISSAGIQARRLCFEVTESAALTRMDETAEFIRAMRSLGVRIALDDFGAGSSSFHYLKALPVDFLKIDGQFIRKMLQDPLNRAAIRCFQEVAEICGLQTIAEFVESEPVLEELRRIGVDFAQGYLIHHPEPLESLWEGLKSQTQRVCG